VFSRSSYNFLSSLSLDEIKLRFFVAAFSFVANGPPLEGKGAADPGFSLRV
jgi:hypothetical protein